MPINGLIRRVLLRRYAAPWLGYAQPAKPKKKSAAFGGR
jgi:hypothetical protein